MDFVEHQGLLETHEDMNSGWTVLDIIKNISTEYVRDIETEKKEIHEIGNKLTLNEQGACIDFLFLDNNIEIPKYYETHLVEVDFNDIKQSNIIGSKLIFDNIQSPIFFVSDPSLLVLLIKPGNIRYSIELFQDGHYNIIKLE